MEAMILAAGAGTRLRPLTDRVPKALVEIGGRPLLGRLIERLAAAGVTHLIVNTHHHAQQIEDYCRGNAPEGVRVDLSFEPDHPVETGGGLLHAAPLFREPGAFFLHNVDVISDVDLAGLMQAHARQAEEGKVLASLAVQTRPSERALLFDDHGLMGWEGSRNREGPAESRKIRTPVGPVRRWAFTGIHVIEPAIFRLCRLTGVFSIITLYLDLAREGWRILPVDVSDAQWLDVGSPEKLAEARRLFR